MPTISLKKKSIITPKRHIKRKKKRKKSLQKRQKNSRIWRPRHKFQLSNRIPPLEITVSSIKFPISDLPA